MIKIAFPAYQPRVQRSDNNNLIFDELRKKWIVLTPEEWVRQHFLQYLLVSLQYPAAMIAVERGFVWNELTRRFDMVVFSPNGQPWMVIECKEMNVALSEAVLDQALRYNRSLGAPYIVITNGVYTAAYHQADGVLHPLTALPAWPPLLKDH